MARLDLKDGATQSAIGTTVVLLIGLVISKSQDLIQIHELFYASLFVLATLAISWSVCLLHMRYHRDDFKSKLNSIEASYARLSEQFRTVSAVYNAEWLLTNKLLMSIERDTKAAEIWIITASLDEEISDALYAPIVSANIARGIRYRYFVPNEAVLKARAKRLRDLLQDSPNVTFDFVQDPMFRIVCNQDVAVYIPTIASKEKASAFMNLPIREHGSDYFIALGEVQTESLVSYLNAHFESRQLGQSVRPTA